MKAKFPLHRVVQREPRYHQPYPNEEPKNIVCYVTERLDCRHTLAFLFLEEAEPLIAKYRRCIECENGRRLCPRPRGEGSQGKGEGIALH